jgi:peroxiredoxin
MFPEDGKSVFRTDAPAAGALPTKSSTSERRAVMVVTPSTMLELGTPAPDFNLTDLDGNSVGLHSFDGRKGLLVIFISRHCPYVQHVKGELARLGRDYIESGLGIVAISPNDIARYPDDAPGKLAEMAREEGFVFPICMDETQDVAKAYRAACTPDFFLYDAERRLVYRGQLDDSRPGNGKPVTGSDLRAAIDSVLASREVSVTQRPSVGCNIKWKFGNEPDYF